jgi:hypothetical protein
MQQQVKFIDVVAFPLDPTSQPLQQDPAHLSTMEVVVLNW